jgi:outer membrane protein OmpA-like peptidoglycan-associated protein
MSDRDYDNIWDRDDLCPDQAVTAEPDPARRGCPAPDSDGDGIFDHLDGCPSTATGPVEQPGRPGCPDPDDDADTITNSRDACPAEPRGLHPDPAPERIGCPAPDGDRDSVPDATDACPREAGAPSPDARRNGCPGLVRIESGQIRINRPVFFDTNADTIRRQSRAVLQAVADALRATPEIRRVSIQGNTDDVGDDAFNLDLSERRAQSVMAALVTNGVEPERLEAHGYGETRPLMNGTTRAARAANRRVEFHIVDPPQSGSQAPVTEPAPAPAPAPDPAPAPASP